jgi:hypothetical protein
LALSDQRIYVFLLDTPGDSVNKESILYCIELAEKWMLFVVSTFVNNEEDVDQVVELLHAKVVKVLMDEKQFNFVEFN